MKKNNLPKPISILILTLLTAIVWVSLSIYRAVAIKPAIDVSQTVSKTITPTLDKDSINKIESSIFLNESQIPQNIGSPTSVPTLTPSPTPISTPVATPSATP